MNKNCLLAILLVLTLCECVGFGASSLEGLHGPVSLKAAPEKINLQFVGFTNQSRYIEGIRGVFTRRGYTFDATTQERVEVVLEEGDPRNAIWKFGNLILTVASGAIIPFYNPVEYKMRFRIFHKGIQVGSCRYSLRNREVFGLLLLPLAPFKWSTVTLSNLMEEAADDYISGCRKSPN